jgi:hypothetical protein
LARPSCSSAHLIRTSRAIGSTVVWAILRALASRRLDVGEQDKAADEAYLSHADAAEIGQVATPQNRGPSPDFAAAPLNRCVEMDRAKPDGRGSTLVARPFRTCD